MKKKEKHELAISKLVLLILALLGLLFVIWVAWIRPSEDAAAINSYEECVEAGYPVELTYPPVCVTPDGQRFVGSEQ